MPTVHPRLTITLQPEVAAVLRRLSELSGNSQSALVGDLLTQALPVFQRMAEAMHAAVVLRDGAMQGSAEIAQSLARAQERIEAQLGLALDDLDEGVRPLVEAGKVARRRARTSAGGARSASATAAGVAPGRGEEGGSTPVPVTRGSGLSGGGSGLPGKGGSGGEL